MAHRPDRQHGPIRQTQVPDYQTCPSSRPPGEGGDWVLVPYTCADCGHTFPCTSTMHVGRCGICHGKMMPGRGVEE